MVTSSLMVCPFPLRNGAARRTRCSAGLNALEENQPASSAPRVFAMTGRDCPRMHCSTILPGPHGGPHLGIGGRSPSWHTGLRLVRSVYR